jgi:capsular polysaccharide transport system ATP-binding protein
MIRFENLSKSFPTPAGRKWVLKDVNLTIPSGVSVGLLGRNGAGKSTLLSLIGGTEKPDEGRIVTSGTVSWPVGFGGSFHGDMTGLQNTRFIARVYGVDTDALCRFVRRFSDLGPYFFAPVRTYSSGMKSRLAFGISMGIPFDTYLVDEVTSVGDAAFKLKSREVFEERMRHAGAIVVTHSTAQLKKLCQAGVVLEDGTMTWFDQIDAAIAHHHANMGTTEDE